MALIKYSLVILCVAHFANCENAKTNSTGDHQQHASVNNASRKSREIGSYIGMISCAMKYDVSCFVDAAESYLDERRTQLLAEADAEFARTTGRSDSASKPSHVADVLGKLISELVNMFKNGISGYFKSAREADDDGSNEINDNEERALTDAPTTDSNGDMRELTSTKKKKKKPLKDLIRLIKVALIAIIIVLKLAILLKILQTAMQFKFLLISVGGFAIQAAKLWMTIRDKKNQHGHEEIVYKHPGGDDYSGPGGYGGEYNAARSAQHLAYVQQRAM